MHINVVELKTVSIAIWTYCHNRSYTHIRVIYQTAVKQMHILTIKVALSPKNAMKLPKRYGYEVLKIILSSLRHTSFLENVTIIQNINLILRYILKLLVSLATSN